MSSKEWKVTTAKTPSFFKIFTELIKPYINSLISLFTNILSAWKVFVALWILKYFGDENDAKLISRNIIKFRESKKITTQDLVDIIDKSKRKKNFKVHSATKTFQALRIFVNKEISELIYGLINSVKVLKKDGVLAVVTFHSLEDRIVKYFFKNLSENKSVSRYEPEIEKKELSFLMPQKKPITPSQQEIKINQQSRSAKLRYLIKKKDVYEIETDIVEKFSNLLEIENLGSKLW